MVLSFDEVGDLLDEIAESFPPELFQNLSGGINLLEDTVTKPEIPQEQMYVMGQYFSGVMGRYINLYYGSFAASAQKEFWDRKEWEQELRTTLAHELTHHMEDMSGLCDLEIQDDEDMARYRKEFGLDS